MQHIGSLQAETQQFINGWVIIDSFNNQPNHTKVMARLDFLYAKIQGQILNGYIQKF